MRWTRPNRTVPIVLAAVVLAACAGGDREVATDASGSRPTGDVAGSSTTTTIDEVVTTLPDDAGDHPLTGVRLATDTAEQLDRVGLVGLDATEVDVNGLMATYEFADGDWWGTRVLIDADGPYLLAPIFPRDPDAGGTLELHLSDGQQVGPPLPLTVTTMAAAPGSFEAAIEALRKSIGAMAVDFGSSWQELAAVAPVDTPTELAPLKLAQLLIDDGTEAGAAGTYAALDADDTALIDALFAKLDLPGALDVDNFASVAPFIPERIATTEPTDDGASDDGETATNGTEPEGFAGPHGFAPLPRQGAGCIPYSTEGQVSAARLSEMMIASAFSDIAVNPDGTPGKTFAALELTLTMGGVLEAGATGGKGKVYETIGKVAGGWKQFNSMQAGLLPSSFTNIEVELSPGDLEEDRPVSAPGTWPEVRVTAASTGYSLDGDIAGALAGAFGGDFVKTRLPKGADGEVEAAADWVGEVANAGGAEPIKNAVGEMLPSEGVITFCPQNFTADIAGAEWSWARRRGNLLTIDNDAQTYVNTTDIGPDTLVVGPIPAKFGQRSIYADEPVETKPIDVEIGPDTIYVTRPGDPASITATIRDAYETELRWSAEKGTWSNGSGVIETPDGDTLSLTTPEDAADFPVRVDVESLSRLNLREDGTPERYDFVNIELAPFTVEPDPGNVTVEEQITFTARDMEGQPIEVEWRATGGTIPSGPSPTGVYTAGDRSGTFTVTAWLPGHPDEQVTVTVNVGDRDCIIGNWEFDVPAFVEAMNRFADGGSVTYLSGDSQVIIREDGTATWVMNDVRLRASQDGQTFTMLWNSTVDNTYTVEGGVYNGGGGTATVNLFVEELGQGTSMTVPSAIGGNATFECEPRETLVVHTQDGDLFHTYNGPA